MSNSISAICTSNGRSISTGPGPARAHQVEGLLERARHLRRLEHGGRPLGHRLGDAGDVDGLEVLLVQARARRLAGDAQDRDAVGAAPNTGR